MAVGIPLPTNYTDGDVWSASDVNDITGTINLLGGGNYAAGKNKIINGDFTVNQRNFSTTSTSGTYGFDRWQFVAGTGTFSYSAQTFTAGAAPVAGYEGTNFARVITSGQTSTSGFAALLQHIENVRTFANQTVTLSFWAKASSGTPKVQPTLEQSFGSGGSAAVVTSGTAVTISTSWARYSATITVPSISGKTIGTSSYLSAQLYTSLGTDYPTYGNIGVQAATIDIWGVQLEQGSTATAFQTATGTIQGELAACQRYYERMINNGQNFSLPGFNNSSTQAYFTWAYKTTKRSNPTITLAPAASDFGVRIPGGSNAALTAYSIIGNTLDNAWIAGTASGLTSGNGIFLIGIGANGYLEASSEL
jgi:hypothetical protein